MNDPTLRPFYVAVMLYGGADDPRRAAALRYFANERGTLYGRQARRILKAAA